LLLDILISAQQKPVIVERPARVSGEPRPYDGLNVTPKAHAFARECRQNVNRSMIGLLRNDGL